MQLLALKSTLLVMPLILGQGIPLSPAQTGTVIGTIRNPEGKPAVGVRVAARVRQETAEEAAAGATLSSLASSDEEGRYRLEGVPPGRYFIAAGPVSLPTYYPGTTEIGRAREVVIAAGGSVTGIDFTIQEATLAYSPRQLSIPFAIFVRVAIPVSIKVDGKLPVFSNGAFTTLRVTRVSDGSYTEVPLGAATISVPVTPGGQDETFRVSVHGLGEGYRVRSLKFGESAGETIKLSTTGTGNSRLLMPGLISQESLVIRGVDAESSPSALTVELENIQAARVGSGVRVSGRAKGIGRRSIYLSNLPGTLYADETFEFRNVPIGRHVLVTRDDPQQVSALGAVVVVGERDVEGVELQALRFVPADIATESRAAGTSPAGVTVPLKSIRARIVDDSQQPVTAATIRVNERYSPWIDIDGEGRFEVPGLLPGRYVIDLQMLDYERITQTVDVEDEDVTVQITVKRRF